MKKISFFLILMWGCGDPNTTQQVAGVWSIEWSAGSETRFGVLVLNEDHSGHFSVEADSDSFILPLNTNTHINVRWQRQDSILTLTRPDNNVVLTYYIKAAGNDLIDMRFAEDINVRLVRK